MEQKALKINGGRFYEHQQFVTDTLRKVKGNTKLEAKWNQIQIILSSEKFIAVENVEKIKTALIEAHANRIHNNLEEESIMMKFNQALLHEINLLNFMIALANDEPELQKGINSRRSTINDQVSRNSSKIPFSRNVYQSCFISYVQTELLKNSTHTEITSFSNIEKQAYTLQSKQFDSKNMDDSKSTKTVTAKECIKPSVPDSKPEDLETMKCAVEQLEMSPVQPEMSPGVIDDILKQSERTASYETVTANESIKPSIPDFKFEDLETMNCAVEQPEMSPGVIDDILKQSEVTASYETVTANESIKPSNPDSKLEDLETMNCAVEQPEMSSSVIDDILKQSEVTASYKTVTANESIKPSVPDFKFEDLETMNCAVEQPEMSPGVIDDILKQSQMAATSSVSEDDSDDAENIANFYKILNADSTNNEVLEALKKCVGDEGLAKLKNLFESENKMSIIKAAEDEKKKQTRKRKSHVRIQQPGVKRIMNEVEKLNEDLKNSFIANDVMKATGKRKCASKKIDYDVSSDQEEDEKYLFIKRQRKQTTHSRLYDKYYDDLSPHQSCGIQNIDQKSTENPSKIKFIANVVDHGNLEFIVDERLLVYLNRKKQLN